MGGSRDVSTLCFGFLVEFYDFSVDLISSDFSWFLRKVYEIPLVSPSSVHPHIPLAQYSLWFIAMGLPFTFYHTIKQNWSTCLRSWYRMWSVTRDLYLVVLSGWCYYKICCNDIVYIDIIKMKALILNPSVQQQHCMGGSKLMFLHFSFLGPIFVQMLNFYGDLPALLLDM